MMIPKQNYCEQKTYQIPRRNTATFHYNHINFVCGWLVNGFAAAQLYRYYAAHTHLYGSCLAVNTHLLFTCSSSMHMMMISTRG
jgi:hypothetical protein